MQHLMMLLALSNLRRLPQLFYRNFNRDLPTKGTINIFNAEDFYKYIEFSTIGLIIDDTGVLTKPSASAKVFLFGDIYLNETKKVDMITDSFKGVSMVKAILFII